MTRSKTFAPRFKALTAALLGALAMAACEGDDPEATSTVGGTTGGQGGADACGPIDAELVSADNQACTPAATDYAPGSATDGWDACISDDGQYHPFETSISSIARIAAFEEIAELLGFGQGVAPSKQAFLDARVAYTQEEGLESRVSRREDPHYPAAPMACNELPVGELPQWADRCVGPAQIQPLLNEAFQDGIEGTEPARSAARIEAALLWFLYVSTYKEAGSCATAQKDCDSSYAYYTGGEAQDGGLGLSRYVSARSGQAHDATWNGILATRCWRDLDNPAGEAMDTAMHDRALAQLDQALLRGVAVIVRQRAEALPCESAWEPVRILGAVLDREATARDAAMAGTLRAALAKTSPDDVDASAVTSALDAIFPCP